MDLIVSTPQLSVIRNGLNIGLLIRYLFILRDDSTSNNALHTCTSYLLISISLTCRLEHSHRRHLSPLWRRHVAFPSPADSTPRHRRGRSLPAVHLSPGVCRDPFYVCVWLWGEVLFISVLCSLSLIPRIFKVTERRWMKFYFWLFKRSQLHFYIFIKF